MAEAVFTISADITPTIDERALERQAQLLASQLNGIMAKSINKVDVSPATGNFRPFQQEISKARGVLDRFQDGISTLPKTFNNVARSGRSAFLKFTDAINVTRREVVGFGRGIRNTIKDSNLFENALDGIRATGSTIADLPDKFQDLAAQIRSGTSVIDRMAEGGDRLAQLFQPLQVQGEVARTEFVELNRSIDQLIGVVQNLGAASRSTGSIIKDQFGVPLFEQQIQSMEELKTIVASSPVLFSRLEGSIQEAFKSGNLTGIHTELLQIIEETERITGPLGRIKQELNEASGGKLFKEVTAEARALNEELRKGAIDKLRELGGNDLLGRFQNIASAFRNLRENVSGAITVVNTLRTTLANILPGQSPISLLVQNISEGVQFFQTLRSVGVSSLDALGVAATSTFDKFKADFTTKNQGLFDFINRAKQEITGLGLQIVQSSLGQKINTSLGSVGNFLNKNLIEPLRAGRGQIKQAFAQIGQDFSNGLGTGIAAAKPTAVQEARKLADESLKSLRSRLRTGSDSKETIKTGVDTGMGYAHGIDSTKGVVKRSIAALGEGLGALTAQVGQFAKSVGAIAATSLAGLGAVALKTGADFNVLKQVINSSLPVLVGSKQASAALLVEVNKLNDSSPFARSSFLELTRVLAGFGVEAQKITPLIDAVQQAVAATGGSEQDILELGQAFAKIQSQGRVTAELLQSFSVRGVDATAILAQGFNVTTGEMKKMISDGLVPAGKAIDVLTKGLKEKFDGATDAVAKNFPGALQRVQARLRDIGGTLLTAFINPEGGGALVDFLNNVADLLSHINKTLLPAFAPLLQKVADALVKVSEKAEGFVKNLTEGDVGGFIEKLKPLAPLLAGLAGLLPAAFGFIPVIGPILAGLGGPITAVAAALAVLVIQSGNAKPVMEGLETSIGGLTATVGTAAGFLQNNFAGSLAVVTGQTKTIASGITGVTGATAKLAGVVPGLGPLGTIFDTIGKGVAKFLNLLFPTVKEGGKLTKVGGGLAKIFPKLAGALKFLTGPLGLAIQIFGTMVATSAKFREGLVRLFNAVKPLALFLGGVFAVAIKIIDEAIKALEPVFVIVVNIVATLFEKLNLVIVPISNFIKKLQEAKVIEKVFQGVKQGIQKAIEFVVGAINILIKAYNAIPFLDNVEEIKIKFDADTDPLKKAAKDAKKALEDQQKAAEASAAAIEDNFNAATKAVEVANKALGDANDALLQAISSASGVIDGAISAARKAADAVAEIAKARAKETEASQTIIDLQKDFARAIEDTITPVDELAQAQRGLRDIQKSKIDLDREEIAIGKENAKLQKELADLQGEEAAEDRAALARSEERAKISLNKARQAEIDLLNELNGANKVSLNLSGLSVEQIRAEIAAARLSGSRNRKKTPQEIEDEKKSARLDVEDAEAAVDSAGEARLEFEEETKEKILEIGEQIRDNDERIKEIADDREDLRLEEVRQLKDIERLRAGETSQQRVILDFDEKIKDAKVIQKEAAEAIDVATKGAALAQAEFKLKIAESKGDAQAILAAQKELWTLQGGDLLASNRGLRDVMGEQLKNVEKARDAAIEMNKQLVNANKLLGAATAIQGAGGSLESFEAQQRGATLGLSDGGSLNPTLLANLERTKNETINSIRRALGAGGAQQKNNDFAPWFPNTTEIERVIAKIKQLYSLPGKTLRDAIAEGLNFFNLSMPGFAAARGLSPGMIHRGMNDGKGLVRMFEFGKEAVLPLTRPSDMKRIVSDPRVLPAVLKAIPGFARGFSPSLLSGGLGNSIITNALTSPNSPLRKLLQDLFNQMGVQFPGFASGYAPGDLGTTGLGSLKPFSLSSLSSSSLSPLLNTLPRWSMPARSNDEISFDAGTSSELSAVVRSARNGGGPANADIYEKKTQREFAESIGEAVKVGVKEAIAESDGLGGDDIDIHVNPNATELQRQIAREVKRQLDKRTGKW